MRIAIIRLLGRRPLERAVFLFFQITYFYPIHLFIFVDVDNAVIIFIRMCSFSI